MSFYLFSL